MGRLIDADKFAEKFTGQYEFMKKLIYEQPTVDAVEVVRCKDCFFHKTLGCLMGGNVRYIMDKNNENCFCCYGEKREDH